MVSKFNMEKLGLLIPLTHILSAEQSPSELHSVEDSTPVDYTIHRYFRVPPNSCIPAIAKIPITINRMANESITNENEWNSVLTIIFKALTLVIVRRGRSTRIALKALTEKPISIMIGRRLVITMTKSRTFHKSRI
jgi:hypothetical protein